MEVSTQSALEQLDAILLQFEQRDKHNSPATAKGLVTTRMRSVIQRLAPRGTPYVAQSATTNEYELAGVVQALRYDYAAGYMRTFQQQLNADLFSDFLAMATYLLQEENLKQPAAVLAGGVLEEHIRKLCELNRIPLIIVDQGGNKPKKLDVLNADLTRASVYGKNDQKQITAWCGIRNSAAHAKYDEFNPGQVRGMIDGIRDFIGRFPA
jgi:hypothetical protein